eukprot:gene8963-biopygen12175
MGARSAPRVFSVVLCTGQPVVRGRKYGQLFPAGRAGRGRMGGPAGPVRGAHAACIVYWEPLHLVSSGAGVARAIGIFWLGWRGRGADIPCSPNRGNIFSFVGSQDRARENGTTPL